MESIILARPSFKIDPVRLRGLREESKLTQLQVANEVHILLGKRKDAGESTILNVYQRIEHTGKTSKKTAHAIAQVFDVSVQMLQGEGAPEDSADIISQIRWQLQEQRDSAKNQTLLEALKKYASTDDSLLDEDTILNEYAIEIAKKIESTQIGHDSNEIARLVALTGWSKAQLQELGAIDGHWLLLTRSYLAYETEVVQGISIVMARIRENFNEMQDVFRDVDTRVIFSRSLPWLHVEVTHPLYRKIKCKFSFVRCKPNVDGFKWVNPTWRDEFWLDDLKDWAFSNTRFFTDFNGNNYPSDLCNLRFEIQEINSTNGTKRIAYSKGYLEELPEKVLQNFKNEGNSHILVVDWLTSGFAQSLAPHLSTFPRECWEIAGRAGGLSIYLNIPLKMWLTDKELISGIKYTIKLVEEVSAGTYRSVPWPDSSVKEVIRKLEKNVFQTYDENDNPVVLQFINLPHDESNIESSTEAK
jgi:transcriptional regulator with XRE-family HTH domain